MNTCEGFPRSGLTLPARERWTELCSVRDVMVSRVSNFCRFCMCKCVSLWVMALPEMTDVF